ncbi:hypothetical protein HK102_006570, partial [Quaeritorhiza haematococci]
RASTLSRISTSLFCILTGLLFAGLAHSFIARRISKLTILTPGNRVLIETANLVGRRRRVVKAERLRTTERVSREVVPVSAGVSAMKKGKVAGTSTTTTGAAQETGMGVNSKGGPTIADRVSGPGMGTGSGNGNGKSFFFLSVDGEKRKYVVEKE